LEADDEDSVDPSSEPWMVEFTEYLKTVEGLGDDVDIVSWWGVSFLVWFICECFC
jgi:hypothetical protein